MTNTSLDNTVILELIKVIKEKVPPIQVRIWEYQASLTYDPFKTVLDKERFINEHVIRHYILHRDEGDYNE